MIENIFSSRVGSKILIHIGRKPYKEFYLNELSKRLEIGLGRTKTILDNLSKERILLKRKSGNRYLFRLNPNNKLTFEIIKLANLDAFLELPKSFRTALNKLVSKYRNTLNDNLITLIIFGSVAKGTARRGSDMDIFVIVKNKPNEKTRKLLRQASYEVSDIFTEISQEYIYTQNNFMENYNIGDDFLINVMSDGIILFDKDNFFSNYLSKGIPKITRKSIEKRLDFAKKRLDECFENLDKLPEAAASMLSGSSISLVRAILLLNHIIPGSKHEIPKQLRLIGENKLASVYIRTKKWFDEMPLDVNKDKIQEIIIFLKEKYREASKSLEDWK